jgi:hypothetical protein
MTSHDYFANVFGSRKGGTFSTSQIEKLMVGSGINSGSIRPNDHGKGNAAQCSCVGTKRQIFKQLSRGKYIVLQFQP